MAPSLSFVPALALALLALPSSLAFLNLFNRPASSQDVSNTNKPVLVDRPSTIRGVPDNFKSKYESEYFVCDAGTKVFSKSVVNDEFCDCDDGTDEPGTSSCPNSSFYCINHGYKMLKISSSRVDDNVCDCCDGSDEMEVACPNTCKQQADRERAVLEVVFNNYRKGSAAREELIKTILDKKETLLTQKEEKTAVIQQLEQDVNKAKSALDDHELAFNTEINLRKEANKNNAYSILGLDSADLSYSAQLLASLAEVLSLDEQKIADEAGLQYTPTKHNFEDDFAGQSKNSANGINSEEASVVKNIEPREDCVFEALTDSLVLNPLCAWPEADRLANTNALIMTILKKYKPFAEVMLILGFHKLHSNFIQSAHLATLFISNTGGEACPSEFESLPQHCSIKDNLSAAISSLDNVQPSADSDPEIQRLRSVHGTLRSQLNEAYSAKNSAINTLQEMERHNNYIEFVALKDQCFDVVDGKFSYSLCVMNNVRQKEVDGHSTVTLGSFSSFEESFDKGYTLKMKFTNGQYCHAFGARSAEVTVVCGEKNVLKSASEPSTCAYALLFESPAACNPKYAMANGIQ
jgi:protein kinase C substrate 80K-H